MGDETPSSRQQIPTISVSVGVKELVAIVTVAMTPFIAFLTMLSSMQNSVSVNQAAIVSVKEMMKENNSYYDRRLERVERIFDRNIDMEEVLRQTKRNKADE